MLLYLWLLALSLVAVHEIVQRKRIVSVLTVWARKYGKKWDS